MGWVSGLMGPYMRPIPVLGSSAMFFSLIAAFVFTPWFALRVRPRMKALERAERREEKARQVVSRLYRPLVDPLIDNRPLGIAFLVGVILTTALVCTLFYFKIVPVKMLPFDNKPEFSVTIDMPEGTALPETANVARQLAESLREMPEVIAVQTYAGTAQPFNFNGLVRHYYLRDKSWQGDLLVMLEDKNARERGSHAIAVAARARLAPLAQRLGARIAVVEMPPGPPVLQTVVAEVYGPTAEVRRRVAADLTGMFGQVEGIVDVDNYMIEPHSYWRFEVDTEKAVRQGISVDTINRNIAMAMGSEKVGDVKRGTVQEPTYIVIQVPLSYRSEITTLGSLPIQSPGGQMVPLAELGRFVRKPADHIIYHKDLRPMEYVVGEMEGRLGAPIYGMLGVEDLLDGYDPPGLGESMSGMPDGLIGPPKTDAMADFEWTGEWTVTYETFRDMGLAFMAALVLIYGLIVWEFRNFALAGLIMSPIPLTLIGIIPGHLIMGAEFTATSMIGMIALGGIIVRQSILIVEFVKIEVARGKRVREAAVSGAEIRMRPILITSLTLMAGAWAIINDPIFQGMAVSLLFGAGVATLMAVIVIPLGCVSLRRQFYLQEAESGEIELSSRYELIELGAEGAPAHRAVGAAASAVPAAPAATPLWLRLWSAAVSVVLAMIKWGGIVFSILSNLLQRIFGGKSDKPVEPPGPPPSRRPPVAPGPAAAPPQPEPPKAASPEPTPPEAVPAAEPTQAAEPAQAPAPAPAEPPAAAGPAATKKATAKKTVTKKAATKKATTKKATAKKASTKKTAAAPGAATKKAAAKKTAARKTTTKKAVVKPDDQGPAES
jgi:multidrug efflux pump subunit AcrB